MSICRITFILCFIIVLQSIAYGGHKVWSWMRSKIIELPLHNQTHSLKEAQEKHLKTIHGEVPKYPQELKVSYEARNENSKDGGNVEIQGLEQNTNSAAEPTKPDRPSGVNPSVLPISYIFPSFKLNNMRFNQDILTSSITKISLTFAVLGLVPIVFYFLTSSDPHVSFTKRYLAFTIHIFVCLFHPLQFFIQSKKLRSYLFSHFTR